MRMSSVPVACLVLGVTIVVDGATKKVDFSDGAVGQAPKGFEFGHTAKTGAPGRWIVQSEGNNKYLAQVGPLFEVYFNGTKLYEAEDSTFSQAGRAGVWTKADSVAQLDDLTVVTK